MNNQTDSLMAAIDSAERVFLAFDTVRVRYILDSAEHKMELLRKYTPESVGKETTILLTDFLHVCRALEKYPADHKNIFPQIVFSRKQLTDMKHDIGNRAMNKKEFDKHFPEEQKAVAELNSDISMTSTKTNLLIEQYDLMKPRVDSFIATLDTTREQEKKNPNLIKQFSEEEE